MSKSKDEHSRDPRINAEWLPTRKLLQRWGYEPPPEPAVDEFQLRGRLWELIYALAGQQIYLLHTDHLTDRELYAELTGENLENEVAEAASGANWYVEMDVSDFEEPEPTQWLTYHATEAERQAYALQHPDAELPPRQPPPCDRDRWLPAPKRAAATAEELDDYLAEMDALLGEDSDPLGLRQADAEIRAERQRKHRTAGRRQTALAILPPDELTDETVGAGLWEMLHNLACRGICVTSTNHMTDRELYRALWDEDMREEALKPPKTSFRSSGWVHDFIGGGSEEDIQTWLRFYASDLDRADHQEEYPDDTLPPHEPPVCQRDWRLPKGPGG